MGWDGKHYPNPPPDGWHQASDGRWWAPGTGPKELRPESVVGDSSQTILPGNDVAIPAINRDPERVGTWPTSDQPAPDQLASDDGAGPPQVPSDRRMTREEFEAARAQKQSNQASGTDHDQTNDDPTDRHQPRQAGLAARDQPAAETSEKSPSKTSETILPGKQAPVMYDPDQSDKLSQVEPIDPTAQMSSQTTILPSNLKPDSTAKTSAKEPPPTKPVPQPASLENSTNAKGEPFVPAPPNPNARPLPVDEEEKGLLIPILGSALAIVLIAGAIFWFFVLRNTDDTDTATSESSTTTTTATTTTDEQSTIAPTTTASTTTAVTTTTAPVTSETTATTEAEEVTPTSATIPRAQIVSKFRESLASNGLSSSVLTDDDIVKFGEDFCFVASNSENRSIYDTEAQAAIDDSSSQLSDEELRLVIDTAIVVSCPDQAERLDITV